jgi:glycerophosphoryl diester phosphodiesterase
MIMLNLFRQWILISVVLFGGLSALAQDPIAQPELELGLHRVIPRTPADLRLLFKYTGQPLPLVSAHRGGAGPELPENCLATFEHTLARTFSMLEVDPRLTKDGEIVVHHDATLDRTTTGKGLLANKTLAELKKLRLKDEDGNVTDYQIPTLDEVLTWARGKTILVLDHKDVPFKTTIEKVRQHNAESYAMLIVSRLEEVVSCYAANPDLMMEVMIPDHKRIVEFDKCGVPWENIIAFVGHIPPEDKSLYKAIHDRSASCMIGTSRNLDRTFDERFTVDRRSLEDDYRELLQRGADIIETDLPREVGPLLFVGQEAPTDKLRSYFTRSRR